jgi:hypothetical protein
VTADERLTIPAERAAADYRALLAAPQLRELSVHTDFGGNEAELAALAAEIREHGLPPGLRRLAVDRWRQWNMPGDDELAHDDSGLRLTLDDPAAADPVVAAFAAVLARDPDIAAISLTFQALGRTAIDGVLDVLLAGPRPALRSLEVACAGRSERDRVQWVATSRVAAVLDHCPGLVALTLPMAELELPRLAHPALRSLELHWLGGTPLGVCDRDEWGPGPVPRAAGLEFLRAAALPALERLAIDFLYDWYVGWRPADIAALCAADLPRLDVLELRYCALAEELCRLLPDAPWAARLGVLDLTGTSLDEPELHAMVAARPRLAALRELWVFRPHAVADAAWQAFAAAYPVKTPL